jgi:ankyrin repeat protein
VVNVRLGYGSLLTNAVLSDSVGLVKLLLEKGADPNLGFEQCLPLTIATNRDNFAMVSQLLNHGANPAPWPFRWYASPLYEAVSIGNLRLVTLLLEHGAHTDASQPEVLAVAVEHLNAKVLATLVDSDRAAQEAMKSVNVWGQHPLHYAITQDSPAVVEVLLKSARLRPQDQDLQAAADMDSPVIMKLLVEAGADTKSAIFSRHTTPSSLMKLMENDTIMTDLVKLMEKRAASGSSK